MAKFDPNRVLPGTIELVRDANGNYTTKVVGLQTINSLSLPEISTTAAVTKTKTDTKTATDITGDTIQKQTQMAFKTGDDNQPDTTGSMLQDEAKKTSDMLANVSTPTTIQDSMIRSNRFDADTFDDQVGSRIEEPTRIESPTKKVFRSDTQRFKEEFDPTKVDSRLAVDKELKGSAAVQRGQIDPPGIDFSFLGGDRFKEGTAFTDAAARQAMTTDEAIGDETKPSMLGDTGGSMNQMSGSLGISTDPSALSTQAEQEAAALGVPDRFKGVSQEGALAGAGEKQDVKPEVKQSALKTLGNSVTTALKNIKSPVMTLLQTVVRPESNIQKMNKSYFTDRGDGRIGGNPATDLYAGFNRVSAFGNLEKAGDKRLATREKTIAKKGYKAGDKFYDDTQKMKEQAKDYKKQKAATQKATQGPAGQGGASGTDSGKIVCTAMYKTTGLEEWKKHIRVWQIFERKYLTPYHEKGYHILFKPFVKGMHKSNIIKALGAHVAKHRTQDLKHIMFNSKPSWIGRIYRKILEPICYLVGRLWR